VGVECPIALGGRIKSCGGEWRRAGYAVTGFAGNERVWSKQGSGRKGKYLRHTTTHYREVTLRSPKLKFMHSTICSRVGSPDEAPVVLGRWLRGGGCWWGHERAICCH
jgi:hypothetical protein